MSYEWAKSIVALVLMIFAAAAAGSMLTLTGKPQAKTPPEKLRFLHRLSGRVFGVLLLGNSIAGFIFFLKAGDGLPLRGILHLFLALALNGIFFLKLGIVKVYRQHLRSAPVLGMTLLVLTFVIVLSTAAVFFGRLFFHPSSLPASNPPAISAGDIPAGEAKAGAVVFQGLCAACHFPDREDRKSGPGLKNLYGKTLPWSGRPSNPENVILQIHSSKGTMPSFPDLQGRALADLLAYLRTL